MDNGFDEHDIPYDVIWLDIEHTDGKKFFTWNPVKFPEPLKMIGNLTENGRKLVTIVDPHFKRDYSFSFHNHCEKNEFYIKNKDGKNYEGRCWLARIFKLAGLFESCRQGLLGISLFP